MSAQCGCDQDGVTGKEAGGDVTVRGRQAEAGRPGLRRQRAELSRWQGRCPAAHSRQKGTWLVRCDAAGPLPRAPPRGLRGCRGEDSK